MSWVRALGNHVRHALGIPARLQAYLAEHASELQVPLAVPRTARTADIVAWHDWFAPRFGTDPYSYGLSSPGRVRGWAPGADCPRQIVMVRRDTSGFSSSETFATWSCDIRDVEVLSGAKSPLEDYPDLDAFAQACAPHLIDPVSADTLTTNLAHGQIRIIANKGRSHDAFERCLWDGRIALCNAGGGHHFAAARYLAGALNQRVSLSAALGVHALVPGSIASLTRDFAMYAVQSGSSSSVFHEIFDGINAIGATWYLHALPRPLEHAHALFFPRSDAGAVAAAKAFQDAGVADLGDHLQNLLRAQLALAA